MRSQRSTSSSRRKSTTPPSQVPTSGSGYPYPGYQLGGPGYPSSYGVPYYSYPWVPYYYPTSGGGWTAPQDQTGHYAENFAPVPHQYHGEVHFVNPVPAGQYYQAYSYRQPPNPFPTSVGSSWAPPPPLPPMGPDPEAYHPRSRKNSSSSNSHGTYIAQPQHPPTFVPDFQSASSSRTDWPSGFAAQGHSYSSRNNSSSNLHQSFGHSADGGDHSVAYESSTWGQGSHERGRSLGRGDQLYRFPTGSSSSFHQPIHGVHPEYATAEPAAEYQLNPLLSNRFMFYPSINWILWDSISTAGMWKEDGTPGLLDKETQVFIGRREVWEAIYITSEPGKTNTFSYAVANWGPILVKPRKDHTIKVMDIMVAISRWLIKPVEARHWQDRTFRENAKRAFDIRKKYAKTQTPIRGEAREEARVADALFCRLRWNGLALSKDFAESKVVYLNLSETQHE